MLICGTRKGSENALATVLVACLPHLGCRIPTRPEPGPDPGADGVWGTRVGTQLGRLRAGATARRGLGDPGGPGAGTGHHPPGGHRRGEDQLPIALVRARTRPGPGAGVVLRGRRPEGESARSFLQRGGVGGPSGEGPLVPWLLAGGGTAAGVRPGNVGHHSRWGAHH